MGTTATAPFVPILTVMPDYGSAPFLWLGTGPDQAGVGPNICDASFFSASGPMSEGLWQKFAAWARDFERNSFYPGSPDEESWDWPAFHARGLQLARWLKDEVGDAYRVVYYKPAEDPERQIDPRSEVLGNGTLQALPRFGRT